MHRSIPNSQSSESLRIPSANSSQPTSSVASASSERETYLSFPTIGAALVTVFIVGASSPATSQSPLLAASAQHSAATYAVGDKRRRLQHSELRRRAIATLLAAEDFRRAAVEREARTNRDELDA